MTGWRNSRSSVVRCLYSGIQHTAYGVRHTAYGIRRSQDRIFAAQYYKNAMTSRNAIVCRGLVKQFGTLRAVDEVDLLLPSGQFLALLGPSGCGKTTLLRLIAGFEDPDAGVLVIGEREVAGPAGTLPPEQRRVGMVFQDYALFPHMDIAANIAYGLPRGPQRKQRVEEMLTIVGLERLGGRMPHELSGGQQQRVALARALAPHPDVLLLDEPFSNLDAGLRLSVRTEVRQILRRAGATVLFVTHDQEEALSLADQVAVMLRGKVVQIAAPRTLYQRPATREVAAFVGDANFLPGEANGDTVVCALGTLPLARTAYGAVEVLVRPEMLLLTPDDTSTPVIAQQTFLGHDQLVEVCLTGGQMVQARLSPWISLSPEQRVRVSVQGPVVAFEQREM